jgi:hypothetical protein
MRVTVWVAR